MLHLDGGSFSGSGTIVRFGVALAALAGQELRLTHMRARRDPPGLRPQHLRFVAHALLDDLEHGATVDRHLADQLIIFAALAAGTSVFRLPQVTDHVHTNRWLVETILGARVHLEGHLLRIEGVGYAAPH